MNQQLTPSLSRFRLVVSTAMAIGIAIAPVTAAVPVAAAMPTAASTAAPTAIAVSAGPTTAVPTGPTAAVATAAATGSDVTWAVRTASNEYGNDRTSFDYTIDPGSTVTDAMVVANRGDSDLDLGVYAADGYTTEDGQFDLVLSGDEPVSIGAWVTADTDQVTIAAGETAEVPFTLTVPENATPGDYAGGIVTSLTQPEAAAGINVDRRLGIRMGLRVGGDLAPSLAIEDARLGWDGGLNPFAGGDATMNYTIHNTGNAVLSARQTADAAGPLGWFPHETDAIDDPPQLLPGESWPVSVSLDDVPATFWFSATATVTPVVVDAAGSTTPLDAMSASAAGWAVPWMLLVLLVVVAAVVVAAVLWTRRRRSHQDARVEEAVKKALAQAEAEPSEA